MALIQQSSSNPALSEKLFERISVETGDTMTVQGTVNKSLILAAIVFVAAYFVMNQFLAGSNVLPYMIGGGIGGFILAMVTVFKPNIAMYTAPLYALLEGLFLGGVSGFAESYAPGIPMQAILLTGGTLFVMLFAYKAGWIKVTEKLRSGIIMATGAVALVYFVSIIMSFFGSSMPMIHSNGLFGIGFSLVVIAIAAMNLLLDFDFIEGAAKRGAPRYIEWYGAFGLMVTLIWLYLEFLRLLMKLQSRD
jgi:uncharacterized YccA/Bax inhibitor family protein